MLQRTLNQMYHPSCMNYMLTAQGIHQKTERVLKEYQTKLEAIVGVPAEKRTFWNTFHALGMADSVAAVESAECVLPSLVSEEKEVRTASADAKQKFSDMWVATYFNSKLYDLLKDTESNQLSNHSSLTDVEKRLIKKTLQMFENNGMHLEAQKREQLITTRKAITSLCEKFCNNINEDNSTILVSLTEADGLDKDFVSSLPKEEVNGESFYKIGCKRPQFIAVMLNAKNEDVRKRMQTATDSRCIKENTKLLEEVLKLRNDAAHLLARPSHAHLELSTKMAHDPHTVQDFLQMVNTKLNDAFAKDYAILESLKKEQQPTPQDPSSSSPSPSINCWDIPFLKRIAREKYLLFNDNEVKRYFPLDRVTSQIFSIYSAILHVTFTKLDVPVWHPTVSAYMVSDAVSKEPLGYFYLDLFSRPGKYAHQCVFPLTPSFTSIDPTDADSSYTVKSSCAILGNFTPSTPNSPSLLLYEEVRTFFHEFGHVMHCVLTSVPYSLFSWSWAIVPWKGGVEQDFLEVPSMMFEMWMRKPNILKQICGHYQNDEKLDDDILSSIAVSGSFLDSIADKTYLSMALYDLEIHLQDGTIGYTYEDEKSLDLIQLMTKMMKNIAKYNAPDGTFKGASWYHPCMGYDAGYYGYLWSEVYACDLFKTFEKNNHSNEVGLRVREEVLKWGGSRDGWEMMVRFLGRDPTVDAYFEIAEEGLLEVEKKIEDVKRKDKK